MLEFIVFIVGLILSCFFAERFLVRSRLKWIVYKPNQFIIVKGIILVRYANGNLHVSRDRNAIAWDKVKEYMLI